MADRFYEVEPGGAAPPVQARKHGLACRPGQGHPINQFEAIRPDLRTPQLAIASVCSDGDRGQTSRCVCVMLDRVATGAAQAEARAVRAFTARRVGYAADALYGVSGRAARSWGDEQLRRARAEAPLLPVAVRRIFLYRSGVGALPILEG